jgi:hypothetical protein
MSWTFQTAWRPILHVAGEAGEDEIVGALDRELFASEARPEFVELGDDLTVAPEVFRQFARSAADATSSGHRLSADFAAAFGSEIAVDARKDTIRTTPLKAIGTGQQRFLKSIRKLVAETNADHLRTALFAPWAYEDHGPTMRWDPADDRRYAYRADDPSNSRVFPIRTVRGANRLAVEALPLFPSAPRGRVLRTAGFTTSKASRWADSEVRWPLWDARVGLATARSLLTHVQLTMEAPDSAVLWGLGVVQVFAARRIRNGDYWNFAPARALLG